MILVELPPFTYTSIVKVHSNTLNQLYQLSKYEYIYVNNHLFNVSRETSSNTH